MKRLFFFALVLFVAFSAYAIDLIVLRDGNIIEAKVTEISPSEIRYKRSNHLDGPTIVIPRATVLSIRYDNGKVEIFNPLPQAGQERTQGTTAAPQGNATPGTTSAVQTNLSTMVLSQINQLPAISIAGRSLKFVFTPNTWEANVNGKTVLSGTLTFQDTGSGYIFILKQTHTYVAGKQISTPGPDITLEYTPPSSLKRIANAEQEKTAKASSKASRTAASGNSTASESAVVYEGNGHKYEVINTSKTWTNARLDCEQRGGYLVTVTSAEEQKFIEELLSKQGKQKNYWLGGNRVGKEWQWVSGEAFTYTHWSPGEPNNAGTGENKLMLMRIPSSGGRSGQWNDNVDKNTAYGSSSFGYICEWD
jgi:hypothetical protein